MPLRAEHLIPFDPAIVPWPTSPSDWFLCLTPEPPTRVWVEHALVDEVLRADRLNPDDTMNRHGTSIHIGARVAAKLEAEPGLVPEGHARSIGFAGTLVPMRVGRFGGETFVFRPRGEFEPNS
jgi:hypothetical protein